MFTVSKRNNSNRFDNDAMSLLPCDRTILIYCEESGAFADLYREAGYNVIVRDTLLNPAHDIVLQEYVGKVHGFLAFPPCTHLAGSGARWWAEKGDEKLKEALHLVDACMRAVAVYKPVFWMLENPVGRLSRYLGKPMMTFNPCDYGGWLDPPGDTYTKRTCLWGKFTVPPRKPVEPIDGSIIIKFPPGEDRKRIRSKTPLGFATAFFHSNQ